MDKNTFLEKIKTIGTCEDEVERRTLLAEISDEVSLIYDNNELLTTNNEKYVADNEKLREANMKLFTRLGEQKSPQEINQNSTGIPNNPVEDKRKFEDLFDDKGGIK